MLLFYWVLSALEFLIRTNHVSCFKGVCLIQPGLATCFDDYDKENLDSCGPQRLDVKILLSILRGKYTIKSNEIKSMLMSSIMGLWAKFGISHNPYLENNACKSMITYTLPLACMKNKQKIWSVEQTFDKPFLETPKFKRLPKLEKRSGLCLC